MNLTATELSESPTSVEIPASAARPVRVLHVIPAFQMGGAERMLVDLFRTLEGTERVEFQLCVLREPGYVYPGFAPAQGIRVLPFEGTWRQAGAVRKCVAELRGLIGEFSPDVLHTHLWMGHYLGGLAARGIGAAHVAHIHNTWEWMSSGRAGFRLRRVIFRRVLKGSGASFIACSDAAGRYYREQLRLSGAAMTTIPYGIDIEAFAPQGRWENFGRGDGTVGRARDNGGGETFGRGDGTVGRPCHNGGQESGTVGRARDNGACRNDDGVVRIGTAGRFVPEKGHCDLIRSVAGLRSSGVDCRLSIAGHGPLEGDYRALVRELGIEGCVEFPGLVEAMAGFYRSVDVYVQPSWSAEGLPLSILEAMSSGCCVVAADVAGAVEAVRDDVTGLAVPAGDVERLTAALRRAGGDAALRERLGRAARREVEERFSVNGMCERVMEAYGRVVWGGGV